MRTCRHSRTNFLTTAAPGGRDTPPAAHSAAFPAVHTKRAASPAAQTESEHMAPGRRGVGLRGGACTPRPPTPRQHGRSSSSAGPPSGGAGALGKEKLTCVGPGAGKSLVPTPFPRCSALTDSSGRGAGRACALGFVLGTRPGGGGEGRGLGSHLRTAPPPPPRPAPRLHVGRPLPGRLSVSPRGRLGSRSACLRVPARTNFLWVASPPSPASLTRWE